MDYDNLKPAEVVHSTPPRMGFFSKLGFVSKAIFLKANRDLNRANMEKNEYKDEIAHLKKKLSEFAGRLDSVVALKSENEKLRYCVTELYEFNRRHYANGYFQRHILTECCRALGIDFFAAFKEHIGLSKTNGQRRVENFCLYRDLAAAKSGYAKWCETAKTKIPFEAWLFELADDATVEYAANTPSADAKPLAAKDLISTVEEAEAFLMGFAADRDGMATGYYHNAAERLFGAASPKTIAEVEEAKRHIAARNRNAQNSQEVANG